VFGKEEISDLGLLQNLVQAEEVQRGLRTAYPFEPHAECDVWAIWRLGEPGRAGA